MTLQQLLGIDLPILQAPMAGVQGSGKTHLALAACELARRAGCSVAYLPLAGAARAGIPALSMCSLNWADLFAHFFGHEAWAKNIHEEILAAYRSADLFLRLTPAMPMPALPKQRTIAPVAALGHDRRGELRAKLTCPPNEKLVLIAFGGFDKDLGAEHWPENSGVRWLIPASWPITRPDMTPIEPLGLPVIDLLRSVDAVLTKPGYGTFVEAACAGIPVLYLRRPDWPEQDALIDWLHEAGQMKRDGQLAGVVLNAGAYTHTSVALHDAIKGTGVPLVELHISNVFAREPFRHHSYISPVARAVMCGWGVQGYALAIDGLAQTPAV